MLLLLLLLFSSHRVFKKNQAIPLEVKDFKTLLLYCHTVVLICEFCIRCCNFHNYKIILYNHSVSSGGSLNLTMMKRQGKKTKSSSTNDFSDFVKLHFEK